MSHDRRTFLALAATAAAGLARPGVLDATVAPDPDAWMDRFTGAHRQVFDVKQSRDGGALVQARNFMDAMQATYGLADRDLAVCIGHHGSGYGIVFDDALWARFGLGEALRIMERDGTTPATANPFRQGRAGAAPGVSIEELQARGTVLLLCGNTLRRVAGAQAQAAGVSVEAMRAEIVAGLVPGTVIVPAMVQAVHRLQRRGFTYVFVQ